MIPRSQAKKLKELATQFPVVAVLGPRQAGKTTLTQAVFPGYTHVSLEELDLRHFAESDPRHFLETYAKDGLILDEVQHVPGLLSYIQTEVGKSKAKGRFILTGSQNFLLSENLSQTLAGRVAILTLLPFSFGELRQAGKLPSKPEELLFAGSYPRVWIDGIAPQDWHPNYLRTYVERDVRQIKNVTDLDLFQRFLKLCAGRCGQLLNLSELGRDCGISVNTAKGWISLLAASYILFLLPPHFTDFSKRIVKSPKLYFYDTGLACSLLGIESVRQVNTHYLKGGLFESLIISNIIKWRYNQGLTSNCYFWRDKTGHEVDCLLEQAGHVIPIEIKGAQTISSDAFGGLRYWNQLANGDPKQSLLVYGGSERQIRSDGRVIGWRQLESALAELA